MPLTTSRGPLTFIQNPNVNSGTQGYTVQITPTTPTYRGLKIGTRVDSGGDHPASLNIGNDFSVDTTTTYRSIHIEDDYTAKQTSNIWNCVMTNKYDGSTTYSQNNGTSPFHNGNIGLQLEGANPNVTLPNYMYLTIQTPSLDAGAGSFAGTITQLYGIYIDDMIGGTTPYSIYTKAGTVRFGGNLLLTASTTSKATLNIPSGTAPTSPADGDMWYDGANIKFRVGASTKTFTIS